MHIAIASLDARKKSDLLVIPFWKGKHHAEPAVDVASIKKRFTPILSLGDFLGKEGEVLLHYVSDEEEKRILFLGLGKQDEMTTEKLRRSYSSVTKLCHKNKLSNIAILVPTCKHLSREDLIRGLTEGLVCPNYVFTALKESSLKEDPVVLLEKITLLGANKQELAWAEHWALIFDSVNFARDLVNGNADDVTPQHLAAVARGLEKTGTHVKTTVFDKKRIAKEKMNLLLAVGRGSTNDPAFIIVEYKGNPKSTNHTVVVGKGVTFDTGGLLIKLRGTGMETMKSDMAGAAVALGVVHAASTLGLKVNVTAVVPSVENSVDANSYKPGDVYRGYGGKTVEISDTDAEGRLILADALAYVEANLKPSRIIDIATLTGSVEVALGDEATGMMSNHDGLADLFVRFGSETGERVWRLPLYEEYKEALKSDIADLKNTGGRHGGCQRAALFLQEFLDKKTPWVHFDIAGTAFFPGGKRYWPKYASGIGVRLILSLLEQG